MEAGYASKAAFASGTWSGPYARDLERISNAVEEGRRIVQTWRSSDFPDGSTDSRLEVLLEPAEGGTKVTLVHTDIPEGQGRLYEQGWVDNILDYQLTRYLSVKG